MARRYNDVFSVSREDFEGTGAFNGFIDIDSQFHIDPFLLQGVGTPELQNSRTRFQNYFVDVIRVLSNSSSLRDVYFRNARNRLIFPEQQFVSLGYSTSGSPGNGIGKTLANRLAETAREIISVGITDPVIFELVGLFEERIGADRISDMTIQIILPDLLSFSQRVSEELSIPTEEIRWNQQVFNVPIDLENNRKVIFIPREILRDLPIAYEWSDIDYVCAYNEQLRYALNQIVGSTWKHATTRIPKRELKDAIIQHPELFQDLLTQYTSKRPVQYDFINDPSGMLSWHDTALLYTDRFPVTLELQDQPTPQQILTLVVDICETFSELMRDNGLSRLLYDQDGIRRKEVYAQLLFFGIADSYCRANDIDLNREVNGGRGPVDFKFSRGYSSKVNVEVKYTSNSHLVRGYTNQLPIYNAAERTNSSVYLVIQVSNSTGTIDTLREIRRDELRAGRRAPEIVVVDGRIHPSASNV